MFIKYEVRTLKPGNLYFMVLEIISIIILTIWEHLETEISVQNLKMAKKLIIITLMLNLFFSLICSVILGLFCPVTHCNYCFF